MHHFLRGLMRKLSCSASAERQKKEQDSYLKNGSAVLEEILALCNGNCRIPIRFFSATEIKRATKHSGEKIELDEGYMVMGSLDNRVVLIRFSHHSYGVHRDIGVTAQMSHLKNVLKLVGCCLEFEEPVMVYEYVEGITLDELLFNKGNTSDHARKSLSWGSRLRIAREVASAVVFLHTEFTTPIIHRDIKPHKVIIDQNSGVAKLVDFSFSISLPPGELEVHDAVCGTLWYLDPEYAISGIVTQKTDVYSFGILLFQLLTGKKVLDSMQFNIEEDNAMDRVDPAIPVEIIDFEEDAGYSTEEGNGMNRVDPAIPIDIIDFEEDAESNIEEDNAMNRVDPAIPVEITDFEEDAESNIEEGNAMNRVNSAIPVEITDFEEDAESNSEEGNVMDRVDSAISEEAIDSEYSRLNAVSHFIEKNNVMDIADPTILEEHGIEIQQQLGDCWDLVKKCTKSKGEERPYMIEVAKELRRIHNCFRAVPLGQN